MSRRLTVALLVLLYTTVVGVFCWKSLRDPIEAIPLPILKPRQLRAPPEHLVVPSTRTGPSNRLLRHAPRDTEGCVDQQASVQVCPNLWLCPEDAVHVVCMGREQYVRE